MCQLRLSGCALGLLVLLLQCGPGQVAGNTGVRFSEFGVATPGAGQIRYIELANISLLQAANVTGATVTVIGPSGLAASFTLPLTPILAAAGATPLGTFDHTTVIVSEPPGLPPGVLPATAVAQHITSTPFVDPAALMPNMPTEVCVSFVSPGAGPPDRVVLNGFTSLGGAGCGGAWKPGLGFVQNPSGRVNRCLYVDSDSALDWEWTTMMPTPGFLDPSIIQHIDGFFVGGTASGAALGGIPPVNGPVSNVFPGAFTGAINVAAAPVIAVKLRFPHPVTGNMRINDPRFDAVITDPANPATGRVTAGGAFTASDPFLGNLLFTSPTTWSLTAFPGGPAPGILDIPMGNTPGPPNSTFAVGVQPNSVLSGNPRIERILTDGQTDSTATASGNVSGVQLDVLPGSTGGGDVWCEVIIYDENGFSYQAKVKNWPANPLNCTVPNLGLGSNAPGNLDIVALCFSPQSELYILPSANRANPTGSGGFMGINFDPLTLFSLGTPPNTDPVHVTTTVDGLYFFSVTDPGLSGLAFDMVASEYVPGTGPGTGFTTPSPPVASVVIQ